MVGVDDIVITGLGCVSPLGIGCDALASSLAEGRSAVRLHCTLDDAPRTTYYAAPVDDFDGKHYVKPRKALKVMSREVQMAYSAAHLAWENAGLANADLDPDRIGVVYGSEVIPGDLLELQGAVLACTSSGKIDWSEWGAEFGKEIFPLWMLRNLPNMPACHVGIAVDARGPNNTIVQEEVSGLLALMEAALVIERGQADVMVVGGVGNRVTPTRLAYRLRQLYDQHPYADTGHENPRCMPFGENRYGIVPSEGAGAIVLERRRHAVARAASIRARYCGGASRCAVPGESYSGSSLAVANAARGALQVADMSAEDVDHVNAQGFGHQQLDMAESVGIQEVLGDTPVTAFSSRMGIAGAACGVLELISSLIGLEQGTRYGMLDHPGASKDCPVNVCRADAKASRSHFLKLSHTPFGQAAAVVVECEA